MRLNPQAKSGSEVPEPRSFETLLAWFDYVRAEGFNVPVQVPWAIQRAQKAWGCDSQETFEWLSQQGLLFVYPDGVTVDLRATSQDLKTLGTSGVVSNDDVSDGDLSNKDG